MTAQDDSNVLQLEPELLDAPPDRWKLPLVAAVDEDVPLRRGDQIGRMLRFGTDEVEIPDDLERLHAHVFGSRRVLRVDWRSPQRENQQAVPCVTCIHG